MLREDVRLLRIPAVSPGTVPTLPCFHTRTPTLCLACVMSLPVLDWCQEFSGLMPIPSPGPVALLLVCKGGIVSSHPVYFPAALISAVFHEKLI